MTDRPTPEQIANDFGVDGENTIDMLAHHGYVIVHPDDVPEMVPTPDDHRTANGWNACRRLIFREATDD